MAHCRLTTPILCSLIACCAASAGAAAPARLTAEALDRSIDLGRAFLLSCQRPDGSFVYEFDAKKGVDLGTRNAVREMGGLWAIALLHRRAPAPETAAAITRSLKLQDVHAKRAATGGRYLTEPGAREWTTNCVALYALSLLDFLATDQDLDAATRKKLQTDLADTVKFLLSLRQSSGRFASTYRTADGRGHEPPNPYADGEVLLALTRYAKEHAPDDAALRDTVLESAAMMYGRYVRSALQADPSSAETSGFYQWGSMAFFELYTSGWPATQSYAGRAVAMARWLIDVQDIVQRKGNTGYAYEGLAVAWELARLSNDTKNQRAIGDAIDKGLSELLTLQVGSPSASAAAVPKEFARTPKARGAILSVAGDPKIRIDTVQHQLHAMMLSRWLLFRPDEAAADSR